MLTEKEAEGIRKFLFIWDDEESFPALEIVDCISEYNLNKILERILSECEKELIN